MPSYIPSPELRATLDSRVFNKHHLRGLPLLDAPEPATATTRRSFLLTASAALASFVLPAGARAADQLVFSPGQLVAAEGMVPTNTGQAMPQPSTETLRLGEIPADFWLRPRELWLQRHNTTEQIKVIYWRDGALVADGYWQACALLRDVRANRMTTIDPAMLDVLRGIAGYYQAWNWPHPIVVTSGFRTLATNNMLSREGAAKNSMHLYGRATDLYIPGIAQRDVGILGMHLQQGGVGFYPSRGFTHLDTGRLRTWRE